ncbi:hypothetical protein ATK36_3075 [Amycolatopsis sulphurea]|uniref:Uncharacterized protein n=1 Tax=Amycolatopsis sulphurea TaxID=76022 RepID=A0A2A9F999_9PSEU|nr:hypothetical protein [Amycolatopsis sulphurea]PFG48007.1 hypothetical protein ATK36_3075 [Amycolatopsis sulphurea]
MGTGAWRAPVQAAIGNVRTPAIKDELINTSTIKDIAPLLEHRAKTRRAKPCALATGMFRLDRVIQQETPCRQEVS